MTDRSKIAFIGMGKESRKKRKRALLLFLLSAMAVIALWPGIFTEPVPVIAGIAVISFSCYACLFFFIYHFRREVFEVVRKVIFLLLTTVVFFIITQLTLRYAGVSYIFIVPFALISVLVRMFYGARLAFFTLLISVLLCSFTVPDRFGFSFINIIAGSAAIFSLSDINRKARVIFSVIIVVLAYIVTYTSYVAASGTLQAVDRNAYFSFFINGLVILLSYPLVFMFEKRFYFLSDTTLLELCDTNQPLLRRLAEEAPGSYHHSLQVAILAEEAARAIGANILLARAGALYHDIGKIQNPRCFIENHADGKNPHDEMDALASASYIIGHVNEGVKLGRRYNLPVQILDFIRTHHGTTKAYYFYKKYLEAGNKAENAGDAFDYPGPRPFSREMAIVMMADAVEASSHTIDKYSEFNISELVERILIIQEQEDQFTDAPLTYKDLTIIRRIFKKGIASIYHSRIVYPVRDAIND